MSWNVGGHFWVSNEDSEIVSLGLKKAREFAPKWTPRYMLTDDSQIEQNAIGIAFPGIEAGEQTVDVLLCTVQVMQNWNRKIYHKPTWVKMIHALHKTTRIGCQQLVDEAISQCPFESMRKYINDYYIPRMHSWGLWNCQHSPILLQATTTNPLKSFHSELKRDSKKSDGFIG